MSTVILSCGDCKVASRQGLVCRVRGEDGEALLAPASWDEETNRMSCCIPKVRAPLRMRGPRGHGVQAMECGAWQSPPLPD